MNNIGRLYQAAWMSVSMILLSGVAAIAEELTPAADTKPAPKAVSAPARPDSATLNHPGRQLFTKFKCQSCHAIEWLGIGAEKEESDDEEESDEDAVKPPDLSGVGHKHSAEFMESFLQKKETIDGRTHKKKFKGPAEELKQLVDWLSLLIRPDQNGEKSDTAAKVAKPQKGK